MRATNIVKFEQAFINIPVGNQKLKESDYIPNGLYPVVDQGQQMISGYTDRNDIVRKDGPYILFGDHTRIVKYIDFSFVVGADGVRLYRARREYDPEFLYLFLKSIVLPNDGYGRHSKHLSEIEVPGIQLAEQRLLATRLKAQLAEVETANSAVEKKLQEARKFVAGLRDKVFLSLENTRRVPLGDMLLGIEAGRSFQTSERFACNDELGVLKVSAVSWSEFKPDEAKAIDGEYFPDARHRVIKGDILISRANTVELVGAVVRVDRDYPNRLLSDKTLRLIPDISKILPDYLVHMLRSPRARLYIEGNATGTSNSMRNISQKTIVAIPIPLPGLEIQRAVAEQLLKIELGLREIEAALNVMRSDILALPPKILAQAFEMHP
jgi:type I restriction enzyme S subunit